MEIPGYKILQTLGQGGMATVYLAIQESFDRKVAIKVMSAQLAQDPAFGDRFQREARIVSQMNHPNIVTVYDVGVVDNHHYLAMQFIDGKELRTRMRDLGLAEKVKIVRDVASALHYAGNKGYVHRDVKPENVMISDEDGRAILMDFGIAKASDGNHSMTKTGMAIGTPYYMSPEQAQGKPVDKRSDIYSLGVMFYQLLTGSVPYDAESGVAIGIKHVTEPVPLLPKHLRVFQPILEKVMAKDPDKRYQSGAQFIKELDAIDVSKLDEVDRILQDEIQKASQTDPHAQTVMGEITPPILSTGNVTTADAARLAERISAGEPLVRKKKASPLSAVLTIAVVAVVLFGGWYVLLRDTPAPTSAASSAAEVPAPMANVENGLPAVASEKPVLSSPPAPQVAPSSGAVKDKPVVEMAAQPGSQAEEVNQAVQVNAEQDKRASEKAAKEKARQEAALEQKRREELSRSKAEAEARELAAKSEQARRDEIARRLAHAKALHEKGALVTPEDDNAVQAYRAVLEIDPANPTATLALKTIESGYLLGIRTLIEQDKMDDAAAQLRSASRLFPASAAISDLMALHQKKSRESETVKPAASPSQAQPKISKLVINDAAFESMELAQKSNLPLGRTAYVGFAYQDFQAPTTLLQAVLYDSARTLKIMQKPVVVTGANGKQFFTLARPVEGFPDGGYVVDLMQGDQKIASTSFTVAH